MSVFKNKLQSGSWSKRNFSWSDIAPSPLPKTLPHHSSPAQVNFLKVDSCLVLPNQSNTQPCFGFYPQHSVKLFGQRLQKMASLGKDGFSLHLPATQFHSIRTTTVRNFFVLSQIFYTYYTIKCINMSFPFTQRYHDVYTVWNLLFKNIQCILVTFPYKEVILFCFKCKVFHHI